MVNTGVDALAVFLGGGGQNGAVIGAVVKPWFFGAVFLLLITILLLIVIILVARRTNGFRELRAAMSGKRVCWFMDDTRSAEMRIHDPSSGLIVDDDLGDFVVNEEGSYVDKKTRNIVMFFNTPMAMGGSIRHFEAADKLRLILGDQKLLQNLSLWMAQGQFVDKDFDALRTNINFSSLKSFGTAMLPHNIMAKINLEIAKHMKGYGKVNTNSIMWFVIIGIGLILLAGIVAYMVMGGHASAAPAVTNIYQGAGNFSNALIG